MPSRLLRGSHSETLMCEAMFEKFDAPPRVSRGWEVLRNRLGSAVKRASRAETVGRRLAEMLGERLAIHRCPITSRDGNEIELLAAVVWVSRSFD